MSVVTDILVLMPLEDFGSLKMNKKMKAAGWTTLKEISGEAGGNRVMQAEVWATAINYFDEEWFIEMLNSVEWECREDIQVMMKSEYDDTFTLYTLSI